MGTRVLLSYQKASDRDTGTAKLPRSEDVVASCQERASFASCSRKAGLLQTDLVRFPRSGVIFYFLAEGGF